MPEVEQPFLRIYCLCGQKMKVSAEMYGLPGKCIACRQKIRVPKPDELPDDTVEIYLKDFPQFLRKGRSEARRKKVATLTPVGAGDEAGPPSIEADEDESTAREDQPRPENASKELSDAAEAAAKLDTGDERAPDETEQARSDRPKKPKRDSVLPLDVLEPLRLICSLDYKLEREKSAIEKGVSKGSRDVREVESYLKRVRDKRAELDDLLHQRLMETAIELTNTREKIAQAELAVRVGEMNYPYYAKAVERLRRRRERLERRQRNLRAWLAVHDPHLAGGYVETSVDALPDDGFQDILPREPELEEPLVTTYTVALRNAMERREKVQRKLGEIENMKRAGGVSKEQLRLTRKDTEAEEQLAEAAVSFNVDRLKQLKSDFTADIQGIDAQLEMTLGRLQVNEIQRRQFDKEEAYLLAAKKDAAKARSLVVRSLSANASNDVPLPRGTFLARLTPKSDESGYGPDSFAAWAAAALAVVAVFVPVAGNISFFAAFQGTSPVTAPLVGAVVLAAAAAVAAVVPRQIWRGTALSIVCAAAIAAGGLFIHNTSFGSSALHEAFRVDSTWALRPGAVLFWASGLLLLGAAAINAALPVVRVVFPVGILAAALVLVAGFTNMFGAWIPEPGVTVRLQDGDPAGSPAAGREGTASFTNVGGRTYHIVRRDSSASDVYQLFIEERFGQSGWRPVSGAVGGSETVSVAPGQRAEMGFTLPPGEYRVILESAPRSDQIAQQFTIPAPEPPVEPENAEPETIGLEIETPEKTPEMEGAADAQPAPAVGLTAPEVELRGILTGADQEPRFSITIHLPDGTTFDIKAKLGERVFDTWIVDEYNPSQQAVTLKNADGDLLIVTPRDRVSFEMAF